MDPPKKLVRILERIIDNKNSSDNIKIKTKNIIKDLQSGHKVCFLKKSLHDLRQAGRNWYKTLDKILK